MKQERRFLNQDISIEGTTSPKISGYASIFSKRSHDLGNFREVVDPKAFDACLATNPDVVGLFNHSNDMVLGRVSAGTLKLSVDEVGLKYEIDPPDTSYANDLLVSMRRKDIRDASFGFYAKRDEWSYDSKTKENIRTLLEVDIFDVSVVSAGAYPDASSQVRSLFPEDKGQLPEAITVKLSELRNAQRKERRGRSILSAVSSSKWAIHPEKLETICAFLTNWSDGHQASKTEIQAAMMGFDQEGLSSNFASEVDDDSTSVAVIPMYGVINQKSSIMTEYCGGCSCESLTRDFRAALADDSVKSILFDIDSPGGTVTGVPELAAEILAARGKKPIVAVSNGFCASAAIWIASAADKFYCMPSGEVGSIGVYTTHQDVSAAMDKAGVKLTFIQAGKYKTEGSPYEPATEGFLAYQQVGVDETYDDFVAAVAAGRGVTTEKVLADYGQGRMLSSKDALAAGMIDGIQTIDQVLSGLLAQSATLVTEPVLFDVPESDLNITKAEGDAACNCLCDACAAGDCEGCSNADCVDPFCLAYHGEGGLIDEGDEGEDDDDDMAKAVQVELEENARYTYIASFMELL